MTEKVDNSSHLIQPRDGDGKIGVQEADAHHRHDGEYHQVDEAQEIVSFPAEYRQFGAVFLAPVDKYVYERQKAHKKGQKVLIVRGHGLLLPRDRFRNQSNP